MHSLGKNCIVDLSLGAGRPGQTQYRVKVNMYMYYLKENKDSDLCLCWAYTDTFVKDVFFFYSCIDASKIVMH